MNEKLRKILDKINLDESYFNLFFNAEINKTSIDDLNNLVKVEISNDGDIPYTLFDELVNKFSKYFDGAKVDLKIINSKEITNNFKTNFDKVLNEFYELLPNIKAVENKIEVIGNNLNIKVVNAREKKDLDSELNK